MTLHEWAVRHGITAAALHELQTAVFNLDPEPAYPGALTSEAGVQAAVRLEASRRGWRVWRNNVGVLPDERGVPVRFGLANDSAALNKRVKSSDLIGLDDTGRFVALECKAPGWRYTATPREVAQLQFIGIVAALGGRARFITSPEQL